ncbi:TerB family tellurite resistance protein [Asticcacaulis sp. ZE23SCel15]|uniref:TerB family tellurite resistance protein n=1 Tax=unclassified Asticcacaulis TaxID=2628350 RepID=UPI00226C9670|nr:MULTISPECIES: TerB family tellurite resistance protein [unclassified Asticcacaulis]WAC49709.1 TerB family tellurite resistance protein [Asticcacaulis sp. SL142]WKL58983.1 TerB family tellurite resistance protein [Asticcacaulis sp. ZE23SCel15]
MSFWKNLAQLAVRQFDPAECPDCPKGPPGRDPAFATAVTALGAKLAKADGLAHDIEQQAFLDVFSPEARSERDVLRLYDLARQTSIGFEAYAQRLARRYARLPHILENVLEGLFHIALSDGTLNHAEETYLETVARLFGIETPIYRRIKSSYVALNDNDPYVILGLNPDAHDGEIRVARNKRLSEFHPDKIAGRGLPPEYITLYNHKSAAINQAYAQIMGERGLN